MPDKDIMALIRQCEDERPWNALDRLTAGLPETTEEMRSGLAVTLAALAEDWRHTADLYDRAKLKGATTTYIVPLRHAAAELDKVVKALEQPRLSARTPPNVQTCPGCRPGVGSAPSAPHEWICGPGETTAKCLGRPAPRDLTGLDALIADAKAEGRGTLRVEAATFPGQVTDTEVIDYLKGDAADIPGTPALAPSGVRSLAEVAAEARTAIETIAAGRPVYCPRCAQDLHRCPGCSEPIEHGEVACAQCNMLQAEPNPHASAEDIADAGLVLDPNGSERGPDDRNYSLAIPPNSESNMQPTYPAPPLSSPPFIGGGPGGAVPTTWASDTMTADGHRTPGNIPATPLLGQPGDAAGGYSHDYIPPGGVPMSYAELMSPVPAAILPPHLSHSQIGTVGECPTKYRAQRLPRVQVGPDGVITPVPGVTEIPQWWAPGGRAFHAFAEGYERSIAQGSTVAGHSPGTTFTPEDAQYEWEIAFGREIELIESTSPVPRSLWRASKGGAEGETWWNANGPLMLSRYVAAREADERTWSMPTGEIGAYDLALELERTVDVETPYGPLPYKAVLDRVRVRQGAGEPWITLIIDDYKTSASMPSDTSQLGEYAQVLRLLGVPPQVKILGRFFNARKGVWTSEVDLEHGEGWTLDWFTHLVASGYAGRLALTTGPTPARPSSFCGGCPVRWACPVKGVKVATP